MNPGVFTQRLLLDAMMMLVGVRMSIDPDTIAQTLRDHSAGLRNFDFQLRREPWRAMRLRPERWSLSRRARIAWRVAGATLTALAFSGLAGLVS